MKKKLSFCLVVLVLLAVGVLHYWAAPTFDHAFQCNGIGPPAKPGDSFKVLREGTYPGLSDAPVTFDEGQNYRPFPSLPGAPDGGIAVYYLSSCTPECMAYWDGTFLWLASNSSHWRRFLPLPPGRLGEKLELIFMDEPEENIYYPSS